MIQSSNIRHNDLSISTLLCIYYTYTMYYILYVNKIHMHIYFEVRTRARVRAGLGMMRDDVGIVRSRRQSEGEGGREGGREGRKEGGRGYIDRVRPRIKALRRRVSMIALFFASR